MNNEFESHIEYDFTPVPLEVWKIGLTGNELAVLLRILYRAGLKRQCFECCDSIAEACCISTRSLTTILAELECLNILHIQRRQGQKKPNLIRVNPIAQWKSKRKNFPSEQATPEKIAGVLQKNFPSTPEKFAEGTILKELNKRELDIYNKVATAHAAAPQEPVTELVTEVLDSKPEKQKTAGALIFEAYQDAYVQRYGLEPLRNAKTNSICAQIAKQLPVDEARALMHFFVQQNVAFYLQRGHAIQLALADLQALRTNMLQNKAMSSRQAFLADKQQAQKNMVDSYLENREKYLKMFK